MIVNSDVVEGLKKIDSESIDCVILDPPYNIGKDYGNNKTNLQMTEYVSWAKEWLSECERILFMGLTLRWRKCVTPKTWYLTFLLSKCFPVYLPSVVTKL